jgi:predicted hotdog family 3-hydroxylacyl-ACP dehydratase
MRERMPATESVLPHRGPALWLTGVRRCEPTHLVATGRIPPESAFASNHSAPAFCGIEICAQAIGYHTAILAAVAHEQVAPVQGYLIGVKELELLVDTIPTGVPLEATVIKGEVVLPLGFYDVELAHGEKVLLRGVISTFLKT